MTIGNNDTNTAPKVVVKVVLSSRQRSLIESIDAELDLIERTVNGLLGDIEPGETAKRWKPEDDGTSHQRREENNFYLERMQTQKNHLLWAKNQIPNDPKFGLCIICEEEIPWERIVEIPHVKRCWTCKTTGRTKDELTGDISVKPLNNESTKLSNRHQYSGA
ncbi:MAG: TraR/DksA C4-type zinc finger protein [Candidatus Komeilibacteria bacterium]